MKNKERPDSDAILLHLCFHCLKFNVNKFYIKNDITSVDCTRTITLLNKT